MQQQWCITSTHDVVSCRKQVTSHYLMPHHDHCRCVQTWTMILEFNDTLEGLVVDVEVIAGGEL